MNPPAINRTCSLEIIGEEKQVFDDTRSAFSALLEIYPRAVWESCDGGMKSETRVWSNRVWQIRDEESGDTYAHTIGMVRVF